MVAAENFGGDDDAASITAAAAATGASLDAETAARSAAQTALAAQSAAEAAVQVVRNARRSTADAVSAAALSTADIAARAASAVAAQAATRAFAAAESALAALVAVAAQLPENTDLEEAQRVADEVASTVAAEVVTQARYTADAASMVAQAVALAAEATAVAAAAAAATVEREAGTAEASQRAVTGSIAATWAASDIAMESSNRVADLAHRRDLPMIAELQLALARDELRMHYQPMYSMETGALVAVEALLRWQHPTRGLLAPGDFLQAAEGRTLTNPIGDWVLATAISQASSWRQSEGAQAPKMWVNISCEQLGGDHLAGVVARLLSETGLPPADLGLEVTERQLIRDVDPFAVGMRALHDLGVSLAVDDFGTGYASLDYLRRFTFDEIKIDRSFVSGVGQDPTDTAIAASIIALGRSLGLTVVAEGVETQQQHAHLHELGCMVSQGYLLHRPAPAEAITAVLERNVVANTAATNDTPAQHCPR